MTAVLKRPLPYGGQTIDLADTRSVLKTLASSRLTQGPAVTAFEAALAEYTGAGYAVACANGTAALHLASLAAGLKRGDRAVTSPNTFVATANAVLYTGAVPVFADINEDTGAIDIGRLREALTGEVKALIPVHYGGAPLDMKEIRAACGEDVVIIEDACHALGAWQRDGSGIKRMVGGCSYSDMTVFSFHPVKSITTGEGGAVTTNDRVLYERLIELRTHGITKTPPHGESWPPWKYEMRSLGFNYRISDIQCALGLSQLKKIEAFMKRRREIAALYDELFSNTEIIKTPPLQRNSESARHLYPVRIDFKGLGVDKEQWFKLMLSEGVALQVHYIPVHLQPYYRERFGYNAGDFPVSERFFHEAASLPIFPALTDEDVRFAAKAVISTLSRAMPSKTKRAV